MKDVENGKRNAEFDSLQAIVDAARAERWHVIEALYDNYTSPEQRIEKVIVFCKLCAVLQVNVKSMDGQFEELSRLVKEMAVDSKIQTRLGRGPQ